MRYSSGQRGQTVNLLIFIFEGSNPSLTTMYAGIAQLARASAFQAECREFESRFPLHWELKYTILIITTSSITLKCKIVFKFSNIYLLHTFLRSRGSGVEHFLGKEEVGGSNPLVSSSNNIVIFLKA